MSDKDTLKRKVTALFSRNTVLINKLEDLEGKYKALLEENYKLNRVVEGLLDTRSVLEEDLKQREASILDKQAIIAEKNYKISVLTRTANELLTLGEERGIIKSWHFHVNTMSFTYEVKNG